MFEELPIDDSKESSKYHSLFVTDLPEELTTIKFDSEDLYNMIGSSDATIIVKPARELYTLYLSELVNDDGELHAVLNRLREATEVDELMIRISSGGGYVSEGIALLGIMKEIFYGRVTTTIDSHAMSMGAILFGYGDKRLAYEYSELMYHNFSTGAYGQGGQIQTTIDFATKNLGRFFKDATKNYLEPTEYDRMIDGKEWYFDTLEMAKRGIVTHVMADGMEIPAEDYIEYRDSGFTLNEYIEYLEIEARG